MARDTEIEDAVFLAEPRGTGIPEPHNHSADGLRRWIRATTRYLQITPTELAKEAALAASTLNRFLRSEDRANLSARTIASLVATARRIENEKSLNPKHLAGEADPILVSVGVVGWIKANDYQPTGAWHAAEFHIRIPMRAPFHSMRNICLEIKDDHAAPTFPSGSLVVVSLIQDVPEAAITTGDFVLMLRTRDTDDAAAPSTHAEATVRRVTESPSGDYWLLPISSESDIPEVRIGPKDTDFRTTYAGKCIMGIIVSSIQNHSTH